MVHFVEDGGESDGLAPVTPLFGDRSRSVAGPDRTAARVTFRDAEPPEADDGEPSDDAWPEGGERAGRNADADIDGGADSSEEVARAEKALVRRLAARQLSVAEARAFLRERGVGPDPAEEILDEFLTRRYLDDVRLAEQLVYQGAEKKGQGRQAIAQTMSSRGIPRDVADAALAPLSDDEADRALEVARSRARGFDGVDEQVALRRLLGQLMRRGYGGSAAMDAARTALAERRSEASGGVRFR